MSTQPFSTSVPFLPTTQSFPQDSQELRSTLSKRDTDIAQVVNSKTNGAYNLIPLNTGNKYYSLQTSDNNTMQQQRPSFRQVFTFGAINPGASITITHGIVGITQIVNWSGSCITDVSVVALANAKYEPIPFVYPPDATANVGIFANDMIITIINGPGNNKILSGTIILEFILN